LRQIKGHCTHTVMLKFYHTMLQLNLPALCALWQKSRDTENILYDVILIAGKEMFGYFVKIRSSWFNIKSQILLFYLFLYYILYICLYIPARCILSAVSSGCGKSGSKCGRVVYSNRTLMFGMLALLRDGFFCCNTVSTLSNKDWFNGGLNLIIETHIHANNILKKDLSDMLGIECD